MINCIVVDDEKPARKEIIYHISKHKMLNLKKELTCGEDALNYLENNKSIDLIFLDINMFDINGIELVKKIKKLNVGEFKVVFITAYDKYAIKAFELNAFDYLLKPFDEKRFKKVIDKLQNKNDENHKNLKNTDVISLSKDGALYPIIKNQIVLVTIENRELVIKTLNDEFVYNKTISCFEKKLNDKSFFRAHRSYLINLNHIEKIIPWFNSTYKVKMKNIDKEIPISRSSIKEFKKIMQII